MTYTPVPVPDIADYLRRMFLTKDAAQAEASRARARVKGTIWYIHPGRGVWIRLNGDAPRECVGRLVGAHAQGRMVIEGNYHESLKRALAKGPVGGLACYFTAGEKWNQEWFLEHIVPHIEEIEIDGEDVTGW